MRLIKFAFYNGPAERVDERLDEDDAASPSMQEVKVLIVDAGQQRKATLTIREKDC